jgi:hypothetical protein
VKVQCPICKRKDFETTEKYDPDVTPNGSFVRCLRPYQIDWLTSSTTLCSEMTCPECCALMAPSGRLTVIPDVIEEEATEEPVTEDPVTEEPVVNKKKKR